MTTTNPYLQVEAVLTAGERDVLLAEITKTNPQLRGAHVADVLDLCDDGDVFVSITDPYWGEHEAELAELGKTAAVALIAAVILTRGMPEELASFHRELCDRLERA